MLRSLFSGISGLRAHQQMMDVTGNNIANVNSVGFKSSQTIFQDTLSQMMKAAGAPQQGQGGTNPAQVGLGVRLAAINTNYTQGSAQMTNRATDVMISGDGFFVVKAVNEDLYTRAGSFNFDADGKLVTSTGAAVRGWTADGAGKVDTNAQLTDIQLPVGTLIAPNATTEMLVNGSLPSDAANGDTIVRSIRTYDMVGKEITVDLSFTKTAPGWNLVASGGTAPSAPVALTFKPDGTLAAPADFNYDLDGAGATPPMTIKVGVTSYPKTNTVSIIGQDGAPAATLQSFSINPDGQLVGVFSNGLKQTVAQLAMANFNNPPGLEKVGDSLLRFTVNSGLAKIGAAGTAGLGTLTAGAVEMSNVDLAQEFTNLIVAQRGFQANSKVISTSDELLQELVNLKR